VNVNFAEIAVVCVVALILFGPEQLPHIARQLGKVAGDLRKVTNSVRREWYNAVYPPASEIRRDLDAGGQALRTLKAQVLAPPPGTQSVPREGTNAADAPQAPPEAPVS
jgi:Tat protein translocase TatB subunit